MSEIQANPWFRDWVTGGRELSEANGLTWHFPLGPNGRAGNVHCWNVSVACNAPAIPVHRLNDFGYDADALRVVNGRLASEGASVIAPAILSSAWQDVVKAGVAWQAFSARNTPSYVVGSFGRALRFLATCVSLRSGSEPWLTSLDDLQWTLSIAGEAQKSGKLRQLVEGVVRKVIDAKMLFDNGPLPMPCCLARTAPHGGRGRRNRSRTSATAGTPRSSPMPRHSGSWRRSSSPRSRRAWSTRSGSRRSACCSCAGCASARPRPSPRTGRA